MRLPARIAQEPLHRAVARVRRRKDDDVERRQRLLAARAQGLRRFLAVAAHSRHGVGEAPRLQRSAISSAARFASKRCASVTAGVAIAEHRRWRRRPSRRRDSACVHRRSDGWCGPTRRLSGARVAIVHRICQRSNRRCASHSAFVSLRSSHSRFLNGTGVAVFDLRCVTRAVPGGEMNWIDPELPSRTDARSSAAAAADQPSRPARRRMAQRHRRWFAARIVAFDATTRKPRMREPVRRPRRRERRAAAERRQGQAVGAVQVLAHSAVLRAGELQLAGH